MSIDQVKEIYVGKKYSDLLKATRNSPVRVVIKSIDKVLFTNPRVLPNNIYLLVSVTTPRGFNQAKYVGMSPQVCANWLDESPHLATIADIEIIDGKSKITINRQTILLLEQKVTALEELTKQLEEKLKICNN